MTNKPDPSKEEILENITGILQKGESPKKTSDAETEKLVAGLAEILFANPKGYNLEPKPDWIARFFTKLAAFVPALLSVVLSTTACLGGAVFLYKVTIDMGTLLAFLLSGLPIALFGTVLAFKMPGSDLRRRKGRKAWRYVWFTLIWSALLLIIAWDWPVVGVCVALVFVSQVCVPWLAEKIFIPLRLGAEILEAKFRRLVGVPELPLELISEADPAGE